MSNEGYMDGVRVKISEKYKPPPRITLPMSYAQRLQLNKQIENIPNYEFLLEKTVVEKMKEWRTIRKEASQELGDRLDKDKRDLAKKDEVDEYENGSGKKHEEVLVPTQYGANSYANILTPMPPNSNVSRITQDKSPFNIAEFEADTSSPFDNMELKSINDMEELAQVLKLENGGNPAHSISNYNLHIPTTSYLQNPNTLNGYYYPSVLQNHTSFCSTASCLPQESCRKTAYKSVPDIIKTLETELHNTHLDNIVKNTKSIEEIDEEFSSLPKPMQDLSKSISSMGFPLSRVARVCKLLGNDHKKVLEHLLVMSELLDLGFPEVSVSEALIQCNNDRDKALDILIS